MDPMLKYLLETNLQQQVVSQELAQSLRAATQELLAPKKTPCSAASIPLPDPYREAPGVLTKLTREDDTEAFLVTFKQVTRHEQWEEERWANSLSG